MAFGGWFLLAGAVALAGWAAAQDAKPEPGGEVKGDPTAAPAQVDPKLPRVLLIGDSISQGYAPPVCALLKNRANVSRVGVNGGPTSRGVENLESWLGTGHWDVIYFNFGLHDIKLLDGGKHQVELDAYEKNLRFIVERLKKTGAQLVWATTTPVPDGNLSPPRKKEDVGPYNAAAAQIMQAHGVAQNDLYALALPQLEKIQRSGNVHFTEKGYVVLAQAVSQAILDALTKAKQK